MNGDRSRRGPARHFVGEAGWPLAIAATAVWLTFFGSAGLVQVATLAAAVVTFIWFGSVDPARLVGPSGHPHGMVFGLTVLGVALVVTAAVLLQTATLFLVGLIVAVAGTVGFVRAVRFGYPGR